MLMLFTSTFLNITIPQRDSRDGQCSSRNGCHLAQDIDAAARNGREMYGVWKSKKGEKIAGLNQKVSLIWSTIPDETQM